MSASINPTIEVDPFTVTGANASTGYIIQMTYAGAPNAIPVDPTIPYLGYASYAAMIQALGLQASKNYAAYPYAYVVGAGANNWTTDALAKAAAIADCNLIIAKRNAAITALGINAANPYVTFGAPVLGPL